MYVVFATGGKQYRAATGEVLKIEKIDADKGATIELDQVLMVGEGADVTVGTPFIDGGKVTATVLEHGRGDKIKVVKLNTQDNPEVPGRYGIVSIPTFMLIKGGEVVHQMLGSMAYPNFKTEVESKL